MYFSPNREKSSALEVGENSGVAGICRIGLAPLQLSDQAQDFGQLGGALDARMGGEDLFQQRRSRARQSDDENGSAQSKPHPLRASKNSRVQMAACSSALRRIGFRLNRFPIFSARCRSGNTERFGELAPVLERLAECEAQMVAVHGPDVGSFAPGRACAISSSVNR